MYRSEMTHATQVAILRAEIERLLLENWQLRGALGYPVPGDVPESDFRCGRCAARAQSAYGGQPLDGIKGCLGTY